MNIFDKFVYDSLFESVGTIGRDDLDPAVFHFNSEGIPILRDSIRVQILKNIDEIRHILPVIDFFLVGAILSRDYERSTPLDISVQVDSQLVDSISVADMLHLLKYLNGHMAADTMHPINYYITTQDFDDVRVDAVYDILNNRWLKSPQRYNLEVEKIVSDFYETLSTIDDRGNIQHDIVDIETLKELDIKDLKRLKILIKKKLYQTESLLHNITSTYRNPGKLRKIPFELYTTPEEIHLYGTQNQLPENIIHKLFEKYYYNKFIKKIEKILDEKNELELSDTPAVNKLMSNIWKVR
jgi:hypothetical protein